MIELENEHIRLKGIIDKLNYQIDYKERIIQNYLKEISEQKIKISQATVLFESQKRKYKDLKIKHNNRLELDLVDKRLLSTYHKTMPIERIAADDILPYTLCLAAALEDFLI